jgi:hypothetical protein
MESQMTAVPSLPQERVSAKYEWDTKSNQQEPMNISASPDFIRWMLPRTTKETTETLIAAFAKSSLFSKSASASQQVIQDLSMTPFDRMGRRITAEWMNLLRQTPPWAIAEPRGHDLVRTSELFDG